MKTSFLYLLIIICSATFTQAQAQKDNYKGAFRGEIPVGEHIQLDADGKAEIRVEYTLSGMIKQIELIPQNKLYSFPKKLDQIEWTEIKPGLWINKIDEGENFVQEYPKRKMIKSHYAGYLLDGEMFDNSFVGF